MMLVIITRKMVMLVMVMTMTKNTTMMAIHHTTLEGNVRTVRC